jgi:zinc D-Ala-D-Ala carboxypeptidase
MYTPKHFKLNEFTRSATADRLNIDNTPTFEVVANLTRLCMLVLDIAREQYGKPIIITSGYRCQRLNKSVGGVSNSQHLQGLACDIVVNDMDKLFNILKHNPHIDQLLYESNGKSKWLHVSIAKCGNTPRRYINSQYNA